jgi:ABC-2 type transport system permease protein
MKRNLALLAGAIILLALINLLASAFYFRWDLTADNRYTLQPATQKLLQGLDKNININVYLHGEFPAGFERLENATRETLQEFRSLSKGRVFFQFIDPSQAASEDERQQNYRKLMELGISPTNLFMNEGGKRSEKLIFPAAVVQGDSLSIPVQLLKGSRSKSSEEQLNQSYENIEFQLATAIREIVQPERKKVGLVVSHSSLPPGRFADIIANLQLFYDVYLDVNNPGTYQGLDALIVMKPDSAFSDSEKYNLDQYVVSGGKILFFVDGTRVDSVAREGSYAQPLDLNLGDLFFKWGIRVNHDLVKDLNSAHIPLNVGNMGEKPQIQPLPWRFFPLLSNFKPHPVTRNSEALYARYLSSIDTIATSPELQRQPLLYTSPYTRTLKAPVLLSYNEARQQPAPEEYAQGVKMAGVLVEGNFQSMYTNRILPSDPRHDSFISSGTGGKVLVCSDGDLVVNDIDYERSTPFPLGYDRVSREVFGNKDFVLYAVDYLTDSEGVILARNKNIAIRLLDKVRIGQEKKWWIAGNVVLPPILICLVTGALAFFSKRNFRLKTP